MKLYTHSLYKSAAQSWSSRNKLKNMFFVLVQPSVTSSRLKCLHSPFFIFIFYFFYLEMAFTLLNMLVVTSCSWASQINCHLWQNNTCINPTFKDASEKCILGCIAALWLLIYPACTPLCCHHTELKHMGLFGGPVPSQDVLLQSKVFSVKALRPRPLEILYLWVTTSTQWSHNH